MHTLKPIDKEIIIDTAKKSGGIITLEENNLIGGLGSAIAEVCMDGGVYPKNFRRMRLNDIYCSVVGSQEYLRTHYLLDETALNKAIMDLINK